MYEFDYISAANASAEDITKSRNDIISNLERRLRSILPEGIDIENLGEPGILDQEMQNPDPQNEQENTPQTTLGTEQTEEYSYSDEDSRAFVEEIRPTEKTVEQEEQSEVPQQEDGEEAVAPIFLTEDQITQINLLYDTLQYVKSGLNVLIKINTPAKEDIKKKHIDSLLSKAKELGLKLNVFVTGFSTFGDEQEHIKFNFSEELMTDLISLNNYLVENGAGALRFLEEPLLPQSAWTIDQVFNATAEVDDVVKTIQDMKLSPYEAAAYIHFYLMANFPYQENLEEPFVPRSLVGILNSNDIVCVGYSYFTKAVVDKLQMPGLKADTFVSAIKKISDKPIDLATMNILPQEGFVHQQVIYHIDDPKYQIKGNYASDACWDAVDEDFPDGKGFANFMIPVDDLTHIKQRKYVFSAIERKADKYDLTKYAQTSKTKIVIPSFIKKYMQDSTPIPYDKIESCIYTILRKMYPKCTKEEIEQSTKGYMTLSKFVAVALFDEDAKNSLTQSGKNLSQEELVEFLTNEK